MRLIVEVFKRAWMLELQSASLVDSDEAPVTAGAEDEEGFESAPVDPHSVGGIMVEHAMQDAVEVQQFSGAGVYPVPTAGKRPFGFRHGG